MEGYWKFWRGGGGGGSLNSNFLKESMKLNWNLQTWGWGLKQQNKTKKNIIKLVCKFFIEITPSQ